MYSAPYGYPNAAGPTFNGGAPPPQNLHLQPGHPQNQSSQPMMYNPQQFAMAASQGHFPGGPNMTPITNIPMPNMTTMTSMPNMMSAATAGPGGMMQNAAIPPHMTAANGQISVGPYQTPYTTPPYGAPIPSTAVSQPQLPANYSAMPPGSMPGYPMNPAGMPQQAQQQQQQQQQQQVMQRMHPPHQSPPGMGPQTPQRPFNPSQGTPNSMPPHHAQFSPQQPQPPQNVMQQQSLPSTNAQPPSATVTTPQTPTFPHTGQGAGVGDASAALTPLSPRSESKEKERVALLLDINAELMYEAVQLQNTLLEHKKENDVLDEQGKPVPRQSTDEERMINHDYTMVIRRLQANLAYLAGLVDRKGGSQPLYPAYLMPPTPNLSIKLRNTTPNPDSDAKSDPQAEREERANILKELYGRLQLLYPGIDPTKEPTHPMDKRAHAPGQPGGHGQNHQVYNRPRGGSNQTSPVPTPAPNRTPQMANLPTPGQAMTPQAV